MSTVTIVTEQLIQLVELTARENGFPAYSPETGGYKAFVRQTASGYVVGLCCIGLALPTPSRWVVFAAHRELVVAGISALFALACMGGPDGPPKRSVSETFQRLQARIAEIVETVEPSL